MENFETTMTVGNAVSVSTPNIATSEVGRISTVETNFEPSVSFDNEEFGAEIDSNNDIAEDILSSAKEDGFEQTLERLAQGEFEGESQISVEPETKDGSKDAEGEVVDVETSEALQTQDEVEMREVDPEKEALMSQIEELKGQVGEFENLKKENADLAKRLERAEQINELSLKTMLELLKLMQKMAEDKDKEEEISMLELMIKMVSFFIQSVIEGDMATEDKEESTGNSGQKKAKKGNSQNDKPIDFAKAAKALEEKKELIAAQQHVEMPAA